MMAGAILTTGGGPDEARGLHAARGEHEQAAGAWDGQSAEADGQGGADEADWGGLLAESCRAGPEGAEGEQEEPCHGPGQLRLLCGAGPASGNPAEAQALRARLREPAAQHEAWLEPFCSPGAGGGCGARTCDTGEGQRRQAREGHRLGGLRHGEGHVPRHEQVVLQARPASMNRIHMLREPVPRRSCPILFTQR